MARVQCIVKGIVQGIAEGIIEVYESVFKRECLQNRVIERKRGAFKREPRKREHWNETSEESDMRALRK
jgi:hypothetical protein